MKNAKSVHGILIENANGKRRDFIMETKLMEKSFEALDAKIRIIMEGFNNILTEVAKLENAVEVQKETPIDLDAIIWVKAEGSKGAYEKTDDTSNMEYKNLAKYLAEHEGKATIQGYFVWKFENGITVGRKKKSW
jgi:hypothetical protein